MDGLVFRGLEIGAGRRTIDFFQTPVLKKPDPGRDILGPPRVAGVRNDRLDPRHRARCRRGVLLAAEPRSFDAAEFYSDRFLRQHLCRRNGRRFRLAADCDGRCAVRSRTPTHPNRLSRDIRSDPVLPRGSLAHMARGPG